MVESDLVARKAELNYTINESNYSINDLKYSINPLNYSIKPIKLTKIYIFTDQSPDFHRMLNPKWGMVTCLM